MEIITISNVRAYLDVNQTAWLNLEDVSRGLGFTQIKNGVEYVRWERVDRYLAELKFPTSGERGYIPENIFYRLAMKANNEVADKFQEFIANKVLPTIRKTGGYVANDELFINTYLPYADETTKLMFRSTLETVRKQNEQIQIMQPKANYFDALVDRNLLTGFRDTAKQLGIGERKFMRWLEDNKFIYRDRNRKPKPYAHHMELFSMRDWANDYKADSQTMITPKGKETFRLLLEKEGLIK